ncbi:MAG: hypothetical protein ACT4QF_14095, partial [Sporichthyaceae bacterium]
MARPIAGVGAATIALAVRTSRRARLRRAPCGVLAEVPLRRRAGVYAARPSPVLAPECGGGS